MSACERAIEVEDMILGLGATEGLLAHVEACADCMDAREMFLAERALFEARPAPAPPALRAPAARVLPLRAYAARVVPALAGLAAAVALLALGHPFAPRHAAMRGPDCDSEPATTSPSADEPLTCDARGFSAPAPAMTLASHVVEAPQCIASDRATCDFPNLASETSSLATP